MFGICSNGELVDEDTMRQLLRTGCLMGVSEKVKQSYNLYVNVLIIVFNVSGSNTSVDLHCT